MEITPIDAQYPLRQLLSKWTSSRGFNSNQFAMQMQTNQIKHQFADHIQAAASTWDHDIFKRYLNFLSDEISNNKKIEEYERQKMAAEAQIKSIEERLRTIKLKESEEAIGLRSSKTTTTSPFSSGDESAAESKLDEVKPIPCEENFEVRHSEAYQTCLESAEYIRKNEEKVQGVIDSLTLRMKKVEKKIEKLTRKIQEHATGVETERIVNIAYHPGQVVSFCTLKRGARSRAHLEGRETNENDCVNEKVDQTMIAGEYEGEMTHDIEISKDFYLVPADRDQQKIFEEHGLVQTSDGQYRAILDGEHYELDLTRRVNPSGKHITYYFKTSWKKGASLPWIAGDHEIPKIVYYEVSLADWHKRRSNLEKEKESVMDSIQKSREELIFYENLTSSHKEQCMENLITSLKDQMETFSQSIRKLEKSQSETIKENARLVKERKMVAVIIKTRWTTAKALDWLTKLVVEIETKRRFDSRMGLGGNLLSTCQSYQDLLMERQRDLLSSCQKDLGQECGTVEEETGLDNQSPEKVQ